MSQINGFELHYYLKNGSHALDALIRNKCEAELLSVLIEIATELKIDAEVLVDAAEIGGFRDFWKVIGENGIQITLLLTILQTLITILPMMHESESEKLENDIRRLKIEEIQLRIEKLNEELGKDSASNVSSEDQALKLVGNLKINKRRSNFYATLSSHQAVEAVGFNVVDARRNSAAEEISIERRKFPEYVLSTNKLKAEEMETEIEIISPVLKEGRFKWKGLYQEEPISFEMLDQAFRDAVLLQDIPFQHGSSILCVLRIYRELDEVGEVKVSGYAVTTVIEKIDNGDRIETPQGRTYKHAKQLAANQGELIYE